MRDFLQKYKLTPNQQWAQKRLRKQYQTSIYFNEVVCKLIALKGGMLNEGYYKTYGKDLTLRYAKEVLDLTDNEIEYKDRNGEDVFNIFLPKEPMQTQQGEEYKKEIIQVFGLCGYYLGFEKEGKNEILYQFEPRNQEPKDKKNTFYWHCAPKKNKKKILKIGLCPRSNNKRFDYPERVYLYKNSIRYNSLKICARLLEKAKVNKDFEYSFFKVRIPDNINVYTDPNYNPDIAVYVKDNIPPSNIEWVGDENIV